MSVARTIAKNTLFNFIANASDLIINFVIGILLARFLGTQDYGLYSFLMWFLTFAVLACNLGLGAMATRFVAESIGRGAHKDAAGLVSLALKLRIISTVVVAGIMIALTGQLTKWFGFPGSDVLFIILAFGLLPHVLNHLLNSIFAGFQKYEYGAYLLLATNPLRAAGIIAVAWLGLGVKQVMLVSISSWILGVVVGLVLLRRLVPLKWLVRPQPMVKEHRTSALKYSFTMTGLFCIGYILWKQIEVVFLGFSHLGEQVGFYTIASNIPSTLITLVPMVFSGVLVPAVAEQFGRGDVERLREIYIRSARYLMILALPLAAAGIALAAPIVTLLYGRDYAPVIPLMQILFIPFALMGVADGAMSVIYGMNHPSFALKIGIVLAALSLGLNYWLIPSHGALGAAIGSSIPRLIAPVLYIKYASAKCHASWPAQDTFKIVFSAALTGTALFALQYFVKAPILSLLISMPLFVAVLLPSLLLLGALREQDVDTLNRIQVSLPPKMRKVYLAILLMASMLIRTRKAWLVRYAGRAAG